MKIKNVAERENLINFFLFNDKVAYSALRKV